MEITAIIALITQLTPVVTGLVQYIGKVRTAAQQTNEWTPEAEAAYQALLSATIDLPEWKPDAK